MLRAVAVTLDGVVVELAAARAAVYAEALAAEGIAASAARLACAAQAAADLGDDAAVRDAALDTAVNAAAGAPADEVAVALAQHRTARLLGARLRHGGVVLAPGAAEAVAALAARCRVALVTALGREDAGYVVEAAGLAPVVGAVVASVAPGAAGGAAWTAAFDRLAARVPGLTRDAVAALVATPAAAAAAREAGLRVAHVGRAMPSNTATPLDAGAPHAHLDHLAGLTPAALDRALAPAPHAPTP